MSILLPSPSFPSRELIGGVIVTYHPDVAFENRFDLVKYQVAHMVVVDNSCTPGVGARLSRLAGACVDVIKNDHNLGVATGLNQGVRRVDEVSEEQDAPVRVAGIENRRLEVHTEGDAHDRGGARQRRTH